MIARREAVGRVMGTPAYRRWRQRLNHTLVRARKGSFDAATWLRPPEPDRHDPYRVLSIDPAVVSHLLPERLPDRVAGRLLGGEWDADVVPLPATALHRGLRQRFHDRLDWTATDLHPSRYTRVCGNEPPQYENYSEAQFLRRAAALDELYDQLARHGYRDHTARSEPVGTEMSVAITRGGLYARHSGGLHRIIMAQLLGLSRAPVRVMVVHAAHAGGPHDPFRAQRLTTPE